MMAKRRLLIMIVALVLWGLGSSARTMYVVSVGICNYKYVNGLRRAENDANAIADLYRTHTTKVSLITGHYATKRNILSALQLAASKCKDDDVLVFFFSGHGVQGGICAYDTNSYGNIVFFSEIQSILRSCRATNKQLYIDACFSGTLKQSGDIRSSNAQSSFSDAQGVMLFMSSRTGQMSRENPRGRYGVFTQYLLDGLKGKADTNRDRIVTAHELFVYVSNNVASFTKGAQNPVMWGKFNDTMRLLNWNKK